ncbi:MAG: hypothetical protein K2X34_11395 [Hyphomonadaceae bacterium]|nr:hypothetical protein [Hyphomonadaceae bacterium]
MDKPTQVAPYRFSWRPWIPRLVIGLFIAVVACWFFAVFDMLPQWVIWASGALWATVLLLLNRQDRLDHEAKIDRIAKEE